jgi:hypothetical protein
MLQLGLGRSGTVSRAGSESQVRGGNENDRIFLYFQGGVLHNACILRPMLSRGSYACKTHDDVRSADVMNVRRRRCGLLIKKELFGASRKTQNVATYVYEYYIGRDIIQYTTKCRISVYLYA